MVGMVGGCSCGLGQVLTMRQLHTPNGKCEVTLGFGLHSGLGQVLTTRQLHTPDGKCEVALEFGVPGWARC